ncbi:hypothetical protein AGRA3207_002087 [Actinomadura graeca]|uniref:Transketolase N-terminal domain-containing protein n=1 Tax=Actinomadura graeca TaxID=2750812 RepID=A0ABX8QR34_9ACTN|nr:1-deoxy-D-xylulose-5-phosphate synthase N-terminal domain-containing protein [Actinomadura graeca]QXJ21250.1 hypothetical protein AGRA3207_002087 [Actinomadura graeca]
MRPPERPPAGTARDDGDPGRLTYAEFADETRRRLVAAIVERRSGHICSALSALDLICTALWRTWDQKTGRPSADIVLSKGHAAPAYYAALSVLSPEMPPLQGRLRRMPGPYEGHPSRHSLPHIPVSTGSLGIGLAWSVGRAIGLAREGGSRRVITIVSDGELQAGLSFEALRLAARERTRLLTVLVDHNGWQTDGPVGPDPAPLLRAVGLDVVGADGHDTGDIGRALEHGGHSGPVAVVARTRRCAGLPAAYRKGPELYGERISDADARILIDSVSGDVGDGHGGNGHGGDR